MSLHSLLFIFLLLLPSKSPRPYAFLPFPSYSSCLSYSSRFCLYFISFVFSLPFAFPFLLSYHFSSCSCLIILACPGASSCLFSSHRFRSSILIFLLTLHFFFSRSSRILCLFFPLDFFVDGSLFAIFYLLFFFLLSLTSSCLVGYFRLSGPFFVLAHFASNCSVLCFFLSLLFSYNS